LLGWCFGDVPHIGMGNEGSYDADIELKGNGALDIYYDVPIITYV
jgi:hypothetical protein